jgi:outer membrane lipoprotein-sorting protein
MSIRNFITALCGAALLLTPSHPVFAQNSGELSNIVVELQEAESKIDSVEAKCTKTMKMSEGLFTAIQSDLRKLGVAQSKLPDKDQYDADIYVAISGSRYRVEGEGDGLAPPTVIYNGSKTYHVTPKSSQSLKSFQQVTETSGGAAAFPYVLAGRKLQGVWFSNILKGGNFRITGTQKDPQLGTLYEVSGTYKPFQKRDLRFWFAQDFGYLCVRSEEIFDKGNAKNIIKIDKLQDVEGLYFPVSVTQENVVKNVKTQNYEANMSVRYDFNQIRINQADPSLFDPNLTPGDSIYEQDKNTMYLLGSDGSKVNLNRVDSGSSSSTLTGWLFVGSIATLLTLGVFALVRWRQREI